MLKRFESLKLLRFCWRFDVLQLIYMLEFYNDRYGMVFLTGLVTQRCKAAKSAHRHSTFETSHVTSHHIKNHHFITTNHHAFLDLVLVGHGHGVGVLQSSAFRRITRRYRRAQCFPLCRCCCSLVEYRLGGL